MPSCQITHRQSNDDKAASSVLFSRWRKRFHQGRPLLQLVPLSQFVRIAGVVDEHPEMIEDVKFLSEYMGEDEHHEMLLVNQRCLDIVWEVLHIELWADEFVDEENIENWSPDYKSIQ